MFLCLRFLKLRYFDNNSTLRRTKIPNSKFSFNSYVYGQTVSFAPAIYVLMHARDCHAHRDLDELSNASDALSNWFRDSL